MRVSLFLFCGILRAASLPGNFDACIFPDNDPYVGLKEGPDWPDRGLPARVDHNDAEYVRAHAWQLFEKVTAGFRKDFKRAADSGLADMVFVRRDQFGRATHAGTDSGARPVFF